MKQTILKTIWTAAFFSSFLINPVLATEITAPNRQDISKENTSFADMYRPVQNKINTSVNTVKDNNQFLSSSVTNNSTNMSTPSNSDELAMSTPVAKSNSKIADEGKMDKPVEAKENKNIFITYLNTTQDFISKGVGFLTPDSSNENTLLGKYKKAKQNILAQGMQYIGIEYKWGGTSEETGFDCSGLVRAVFQNSVGMTLPRTALEMSKVGKKVASFDSLKPGDLVFFNTMKKKFSHVGIYVGDNKFLHSPRTGAQVRVEEMDVKYWKKRFNGATRIDVSNMPKPELQ
jgi:cell wall-associated NlpC family hydrolase